MSAAILNEVSLGLIQDKAVAAAGAEGKVCILKPEAEPHHRYLVVSPDGSHELVDAEASPRKHALGSIEDVVGWCKSKGTEATVVWFSEEGCVVIEDDLTRRDRLSMRLAFTEQWQLMCHLADNKPLFSQKDFVRLLRIDLHGLTSDQRLLTFARNAKFSGQSSKGGEVLHGRESLGNTIEAAALGINSGECPEELQINVRIFTDPHLQDRQPVNCAVELDVHSAAFRLTPYPLQLQLALEAEVCAIGAYLRENLEQPVFRGVP